MQDATLRWFFADNPSWPPSLPGKLICGSPQAFLSKVTSLFPIILNGALSNSDVENGLDDENVRFSMTTL